MDIIVWDHHAMTCHAMPCRAMPLTPGAADVLAMVVHTGVWVVYIGVHMYIYISYVCDNLSPRGSLLDSYCLQINVDQGVQDVQDVQDVQEHIRTHCGFLRFLMIRIGWSLTILVHLIEETSKDLQGLSHQFPSRKSEKTLASNGAIFDSIIIIYWRILRCFFDTNVSYIINNNININSLSILSESTMFSNMFWEVPTLINFIQELLSLFLPILYVDLGDFNQLSTGSELCSLSSILVDSIEETTKDLSVMSEINLAKARSISTHYYPNCSRVLALDVGSNEVLRKAAEGRFRRPLAQMVILSSFTGRRGQEMLGTDAELTARSR